MVGSSVFGSWRSVLGLVCAPLESVVLVGIREYLVSHPPQQTGCGLCGQNERLHHCGGQLADHTPHSTCQPLLLMAPRRHIADGLSRVQDALWRSEVNTEVYVGRLAQIDWDWGQDRASVPLELCRRPWPHLPGGLRAAGPSASVWGACPARSGGWVPPGTGYHTRSLLWPGGVLGTLDEESWTGQTGLTSGPPESASKDPAGPQGSSGKPPSHHVP